MAENKKNEAIDLNNELIANFIVCSRHIYSYRHTNVSQMSVIRILGDNGGTLPQKQLQTKMNIKAASVSELVFKLIDQKLVEKEKNPTDRRSYDLHLTKKGRELYRKTKDEKDSYAELFYFLSEKEKEDLLMILNKLVDNWSQSDPRIMENKSNHSPIIRGKSGELKIKDKHHIQ